jgi:hypothetical protein
VFTNAIVKQQIYRIDDGLHLGSSNNTIQVPLDKHSSNETPLRAQLKRSFYRSLAGRWLLQQPGPWMTFQIVQFKEPDLHQG